MPELMIKINEEEYEFYNKLIKGEIIIEYYNYDTVSYDFLFVFKDKYCYSCNNCIEIINKNEFSKFFFVIISGYNYNINKKNLNNIVENKLKNNIIYDYKTNYKYIYFNENKIFTNDCKKISLEDYIINFIPILLSGNIDY